MKDVNCYLLDDDPMQSAVLVDYISSTEGLAVVGAAQNPLEAIKFFNKQGSTIDLLFLDVEMPVLNGLDFIESIAFDGQIVLVTSNPKYAVDSYSYEVLDFLLKPVSYDRFLVSIAKYKKAIGTSKTGDSESIFLKIDGALIKFKVNDLLYFKGADDYVEIYTAQKKYLVNTSLTKLNAKLPSAAFMRIHRSTIVNMNALQEVESTGVVVNNVYLPVSKTYKKALLERINVI